MAVQYWFRANRPQYTFLVAGTVGWILANSTRPTGFIYDNMMIDPTVARASHVFGVEKLLHLGSSCIYPCEAQPMKEEYLLAGALEPTNEAYAIAKIAGIRLCQVRSVVYTQAAVVYDPSKPDGSTRKPLDASRLRPLGWRDRIALADGVAATYDWLLEHQAQARDVAAAEHA